MRMMERYPGSCLSLGVAMVGALSWLLAGTWWSITLFTVLLLGPAIEDARNGYISDGWSMLIAAAGLVNSWQAGHSVESFLSALCILMVYGALYLIKREAAGMGDVLLSAACALWLTPVFVFLFLWLASVLALVGYGVLFLWERNEKRKGIRFAPFLALGGVIAYGLQEMVGPALFSSLWLFAG